jgi:uncharacterized BrkB/YihY/UPF0761 family membrane protein
MPGNFFTDPNWAPNLADTLERVVGTVRDKTTTKVVVIVRALVFGIVIGLSAVVAMILLVILGTKLLQRVVNLGGAIDADSAIWVSYLVMGALFMLIAVIAMRKRTSKHEPAA